VNTELTFLVLDDDDDSRFLTQHALKRGFPGCHVVESLSPDDTLLQIHAVRPDGILTDHHLGTHDGAAFMHQLRDAGVTCPVVMLTSSSDPTVHRRAYEAGAAHVFAGSDRDFVGFFRSQLQR
jgi:CheY-like chemotaxis protein